MRYQGKVGEFKPVGFLISFAASLLFALLIYSFLPFYAETPKQEPQPSVPPTADSPLLKEHDDKLRSMGARIAELEELRDLKVRVERVEKKLNMQEPHR